MYGDAFVDKGGSECTVADIRTAGYLPSEEKNAEREQKLQDLLRRMIEEEDGSVCVNRKRYL